MPGLCESAMLFNPASTKRQGVAAALVERRLQVLRLTYCRQSGVRL